VITSGKKAAAKDHLDAADNWFIELAKKKKKEVTLSDIIFRGGEGIT